MCLSWLKNMGSIMQRRMTTNIKSTTKLLSFNNQFSNKEKYMMFEHFKIHREMLVADSYIPIDKDSNTYKWENKLTKINTCPIPPKLLQEAQATGFRLMSPLKVHEYFKYPSLVLALVIM